MTTPTELIADKTFADLGISAESLKLVESSGFKHPTPIQQALIPPALEGKDIIGLAQTGSGKTAAFVLPVAERLRHGNGVRGLILCPTREIALQTKAFLDLLGKHHDLKTVCLIGGVKLGPQIQDLKSGADVLVATPGRLLDMVERGFTTLKNIEELVLDEADHMFNLGFLPQIREILSMIPKNRHTMMISATMPPAVELLAQDHLKDAIRIDILPESRAAEGITHQLYLVDTLDRPKCLQALVNEITGSTIVFSQTRGDVNWLHKLFTNANHPATLIHSDRTQRERVKALEDFRAGKYQVLIATDIAARGIDVQGIEHVINYEMPANVEEYIHRAGRTARAGAKGLVSSIGTWRDLPLIRNIESALGQKLTRCKVEGVPPFEEPVATTTSRRRR